MKHLKFLVIPLLALSLAGCANLRNAYDVLTHASVSPTAVIVAANAFDAVQNTATNYLQWTKCTGKNGPICRDPKVTVTIIKAVRSGRVARNNLEQFLQDHPGQLGPQGDYDALIAATNTLKEIITTYHIGSAS